MTKDQFIERVSEEINSYVCPDCGGRSVVRVEFVGAWPEPGVLTVGVESICCEANRRRFADRANKVARECFERWILS